MSKQNKKGYNSLKQIYDYVSSRILWGYGWRCCICGLGLNRRLHCRWCRWVSRGVYQSYQQYFCWYDSIKRNDYLPRSGDPSMADKNLGTSWQMSAAYFNLLFPWRWERILNFSSRYKFHLDKQIKPLHLVRNQTRPFHYQECHHGWTKINKDYSWKVFYWDCLP